MSSDPEVWTWQEAEEALTKNVSNRHLRPNDVDKYARDMKSKATDGKPLWRDCSAPIQFDWDGNLIDGQHRLYAQVRSKTKQSWWVLRDVDPASQKNIDIGIPRNVADALKFEGYTGTIVLSAVARWAFLLEMGAAGNPRIKPSLEEVVDMVKRHPDLQHSASMGVYARTGFVMLNPTPVGAAHWWIAQHNDHTEADMFIDRFVHMNREPDGSPILALMSRFNKARQDRETIQTRVQIASMIRCWNYDVRGRYITKMATRSRTGEYKLQEVLKREVSQADGITAPDPSDAEKDTGA